MAIYLMPTQYPSTRIAPYESDPTDQVVARVALAARDLENAAAGTLDVDRLNQLRERARVCRDQLEDVFQFVLACESKASEAKS